MSEPAQQDVPIRPGIYSREDVRDPQNALRGTRCRRCEETFFPPRRVCPRCHSAAEVSDVQLGRRGRVYAVTRVVRPAAQFREPYFLGLVDLVEGVRVLAQVTPGSGDEVQIGMPVELEICPLFETPDGQRIWGHRFAVASSPPG